MPKAPDGLHTWQQLLERRRDDAGRAVAEQRARVQEEQGRMHSLEGFRRDYLERLAGGQGSPSSVAELQRCQHYLANIEQAIGQQAGRIHAAEQRMAECQAALMALRRQELSVQGLVETRSREVRARDARRDQAASDELAGQAYERRRRQAQPGNVD